MAHLDQWKPVLQLRDELQEQVLKDDIRRHFWSWYEAHKDDVLAKINIIFWSKTIKVRDIRHVFIMLFGRP